MMLVRPVARPISSPEAERHPMPPIDAEQSRWFALEVQPHEPALRAYLHSHFPRLQDSDDVIQETYTRLLREKHAGRIQHTRAFMFTAARNVALDFFRRRRTSGADAIPHSDPTSVVEDRPDAAEALSQRQELEIVAEAVRALPTRCRQVIMLRYLKGCSYKEIAALLDVSTETVKTQMAKGVQRCAEFCAERGLAGARVKILSLPESHE
jgi:RNA polymerase sigma factor (sigma-70 family)